jgi:uncharacterized protein (TIGR03437 family)
MPATLLSGAATSGTGSATVTGGTGNYAGATGSFPTVSGTASGSIATSISLTFSGAGSITTGGGGTTPPPTSNNPTITAVLDAGGYTSNIAQGSIFVVKGTNLSGSGYSASGYPLLTTYNSVKITFTPASGGTGTDALMVYTYNQSGVNQLAALLPSTVATGNYNVTVTNNTTTGSPFQVTVVKSKPGLVTRDSAGDGLAVVSNYIVSSASYDVDAYTTGSGLSPAKPGQTLVAWATGLGPVPGAENVGSAGYDFTKNGATVQVLVGGMAITPGYAGRSPNSTGLDQINFVLPSNVPTGCTVSFQLSINNVLSNLTYISIAPDANSSACVLPGYTSSQLAGFDQGSTFTTGGFNIFSQAFSSGGQSGTFSSAGGSFVLYNGFELGSVPVQLGSLASGSCYVTQSTTTSQSGGATVSGGKALDAGAVTLTGPTGSNLTNAAFTETSNVYSLSIGGIPGLGGGNNGTIVAGTYTLNGAGGADIGKFTGSVTLGAPLTVTGGLPSTVNRSAGLTLNWTGGNSTDLVEIFGTSTVGSTSTSFTCVTTAGQKTFTVDKSILTQLPASTGTSNSLLVYSFVSPVSGNGLFTAPLTAGGGSVNASFLAYMGTGNTPAYQ